MDFALASGSCKNLADFNLALLLALKTRFLQNLWIS